jgi:hypothetical protein
VKLKIVSFQIARAGQAGTDYFGQRGLSSQYVVRVCGYVGEVHAANIDPAFVLRFYGGKNRRLCLHSGPIQRSAGSNPKVAGTGKSAERNQLSKFRLGHDCHSA